MWGNWINFTGEVATPNANITDEVIDKYELQEKANKHDNMYAEVIKGMYGLIQAGLLPNQVLQKQLNKHGYYLNKLVPSLWKHKWRLI